MRIYSSSVLRKYAEGMKSKSFIGTKHGPLKDDHLPPKRGVLFMFLFLEIDFVGLLWSSLGLKDPNLQLVKGI